VNTKRIEDFPVEHCRAVDVEPRKVQLPIFAIVRNERYVIAVTRYECDRRFLRVDFATDPNVQWPLESVRSALDSDAVFAQKIDNHIGQRRPFFD
jgi:hypothetical protein